MPLAKAQGEQRRISIDMNVLGIETSCDETSAAVVKNGKTVLSNIVLSSLRDHQKFGGIIPEIASRRQIELINTVVKQSLSVAKCKLSSIDALAVTTHPGLIGSLLVGMSFSRGLSHALHKKLVEVNHIKAHIYANFLDQPQPPRLPAIGLVVSGGHTALYYLKNHLDYKIIGQTQDDAAGEAFDKVALILGLGYPGGPAIDRIAPSGQNQQIRFPVAELKNTFNFSFSGIKTSVLYYTRQCPPKDLDKTKVAFSFQKSVVAILVKKSLAACQSYKAKTLLIGGGVAANSQLRAELLKQAATQGIAVYFPALPLCLDNAAMIAGYAYQFIKNS